MKIVVTGADGLLGQALLAELSSQHEVTGVDKNEMDITRHDAVRETIRTLNPDLVIHGAALTNVDYCAENPEIALQVNGYGTRHVALACQDVGATMVYISTNEVFDGHNTGAYLEYDPTGAVNPYGYSKWVGEQIVRELLNRFYIVRFSWLFGHGRRNFIQVIREHAEQGKPLRVVVNEVATPTYVKDVVPAIHRLIQTDIYGIYHLPNAGRASRWAFARHVLDSAGYADFPIEKISAAEYARASTPPTYSVLMNSAAAYYGIELRDWRDAVQDFLNTEEQENAS